MSFVFNNIHNRQHKIILLMLIAINAWRQAVTKVVFRSVITNERVFLFQMFTIVVCWFYLGGIVVMSKFTVVAEIGKPNALANSFKEYSPL